ncbi:MAG: Mrp/NBP35 family ATP-binding protein [Bdellovibrionota bacterium]
MDVNLIALLAEVKAIEKLLPADIQTQFENFSFQDRAHTVSQESNRIVVSFFSDNLTLAIKTQLEKIIRECLLHHKLDVVVFFERKEKKPPTTQPSQQPAHKPKPEPHEQKAPSGKKPIDGVKQIIAVASGKGGVGKSTVSVNLALALYNQGYKVGILDADIYGPSVPTMLNIHKDPMLNQNNKIIPPESFGLKVMSFGFFAPEDTAVIWRGPMIMKALQQFFWDVDWGDLDFLIIDLPPGTGDAQLTLVQSIPISGAVIVTTPQNVALLDAVKGISMFQKTEVPILGVVENMSSYSCPTCGTESHIFGQGGAQRVSEKFGVPLLGHVPLIPEIRAAGDLGEPLTVIPGHGIRLRFAEIAEKVVQNLNK